MGDAVTWVTRRTKRPARGVVVEVVEAGNLPTTLPPSQLSKHTTGPRESKSYVVSEVTDGKVQPVRHWPTTTVSPL